MTTRIRRIANIILSLTLCLGISPGILGQNQSPKQVFAQERKEDGLDTVGFDTLNGRVEAALPEDFSNGDVISGTVIEEPKGETKEEIALNQDELRGYVVEVEKCKDVKEPPAKSVPTDATAAVQDEHSDIVPPPVISQQAPNIALGQSHDNPFTCSVPIVVESFAIVLKKRSGELVCRREVHCSHRHKDGIRITGNQAEFPSTGTAGKPLLIPGVYDGRSRTSRVRVNGRNCLVMAESPRRQIIRAPLDCTGRCIIDSVECGFVKRGTIALLPAPTLVRVPAPAVSNRARSEQPHPSAPGDLNGQWNCTGTTLGGTVTTQMGTQNIPGGFTAQSTVTLTQQGDQVTLRYAQAGEIVYSGSFDGRTVQLEYTSPHGSKSKQTLTYDPASDTLQGEGEERQSSPGVTSVMRSSCKMQRMH